MMGKQSNFAFLSFTMGTTVNFRVPLMHDGKCSQISLSITQISRFPGKLEI